MKALLLAPQPYYSHRGTPMNVRAMLRVLSGAGVEVDLLTYPGGEDTPMPGLTIRRVRRPPGVRKVPIGPSPAKVALDAVMLPTAWGMARRGSYALVHAIEESVYLGLLLKRRFRLPLLYDMDSSLASSLAAYGWGRGGAARSFFASMERMAIRGSDGVVTVCRALTDLVRSVDPARPVWQIEDTPLCAGPPQAPPDADALSAALAGRKVLLYTGNFETYQGIPLLVAAMPAVLARHPEALFVLVGGSGPALGEVRGEIARTGVAAAALILEPRPPEQMGWFMERAFALLSPRCKGENTPLKIYTYLDSGRPVVATRMPTHTQVLEEGWSVLAPPDPEGFAREINDLLEDQARAERLGREGKRIVAERYSPAVFGEKLLAAYRAVGGLGPGGGERG